MRGFPKQANVIVKADVNDRVSPAKKAITGSDLRANKGNK